MQSTYSIRTSLLAAGYLTAFFCLAIGLQLFLQNFVGLNLIGSTAAWIIGLADQILTLTGWTIIGFLPIGGRVVLHAVRAARSNLTSAHYHELHHLQELAIAIGMIGTLWAFVSTATAYAGQGVTDPLATLMTILMGLGSTLVGIIIAMAVQSIFYFSPENTQ